MVSSLLAETSYHKVLRVSSFVAALMLVFQTGLLVPQTAELARLTQQQVATAVGMTARVESTELSQYTAALTAMEQELLAREARLAEREIQLNQRAAESSIDYSTFVLSGILFILLVLIVLNYLLDYLRVREDRAELAVS